MDNTPISKAIEAAGSQSKLAQALGGIHTSLVAQWATGRRPVAAHHCPTIEAATGIRCEELRPDLAWERDETGKVVGYRVLIAQPPANDPHPPREAA